MPIVSLDGVERTVTQEEEDALSYNPPATESQIRQERDQLIAATDWWATSDRTMTAEQTAYRQALRDITDQSGFPTDITWPTKPEQRMAMNKRTIASAHDRIDSLEKEIIAIKTEVKIQFKDLFSRVKRMEGIMIATTGSIIALLLAVLTKMG